MHADVVTSPFLQHSALLFAELYVDVIEVDLLGFDLCDLCVYFLFFFQDSLRSSIIIIRNIIIS